MKIARNVIPSLLDALLMLDGSDPKNPFKFTPKVRYSLAKNVRILTTQFKDIEKARLGMIRQLSPKTFQIEKNTPEAVEFSKQWEPFDAEEVEVNGVMRFTLAEMNLDVNDIPIAALAKLGPILIEDAEAASAPPPEK